TATAALDDYDALRAGAAIEHFVDQLSNWYVRGNRRRFWKAAGGADKQSAYATLHECLEVVTRLIAPFMRFLSDSIWQNLVRAVHAEAPPSVHMAAWPGFRADRVDRQLLVEMRAAQKVIALGRSARSDAQLKIRQPLRRVLVRAPDAASAAAVVRNQDLI